MTGGDAVTGAAISLVMRPESSPPAALSSAVRCVGGRLLDELDRLEDRECLLPRGIEVGRWGEHREHQEAVPIRHRDEPKIELGPETEVTIGSAEYRVVAEVRVEIDAFSRKPAQLDPAALAGPDRATRSQQVQGIAGSEPGDGDGPIGASNVVRPSERQHPGGQASDRDAVVALQVHEDGVEMPG